MKCLSVYLASNSISVKVVIADHNNKKKVIVMMDVKLMSREYT